MNIPIYQVDSFSRDPFRGNPAGVCILPSPQPDEWMQNVAKEMNLSETAFLLKESSGYQLRWFTPRVEVSLCGHATLASAHILWETEREVHHSMLHFNSRSGLLKAGYNEGWIELDFPRTDFRPAGPPEGLLFALGIEPVFIAEYRNSYLVEIADETQLRALQPDMGLLEKVETRTVAVTCRSTNQEYDFVSRYFAPKVGVPEDPVTGSAHCVLTPYWAEKLGKTHLHAYQASARGGELRLRLEGDRVILGGQAVTIIEGILRA